MERRQKSPRFSYCLPFALLFSACTALPMRQATPAPKARDLTLALTTSLPAASGDLDVTARCVGTVSGVRVTAAVDVWPGGEEVYDRVTPVRFLIENESDQPLRINYESMRIRSDDGHTYAALSPYAVLGSRRVLGTGLQQVGFTVAQPYREIYPGLEPYAGPQACSSKRYRETHDAYWKKSGVPTAAMLQHALPEGVLVAGHGKIVGYVFFERLKPGTKRMVLRFQLHDPRNDVLFGSLGLDLKPPAVAVAKPRLAVDLTDKPATRKRSSRRKHRGRRHHRR